MIEFPFEAAIATADDMHELGIRLGTQLRAGDLLVLTGPLGAGKTTLTRGIGEGLGVRGPVTSPTFVLARTHPNLSDGPPLVHVDAYRLSSAAELDDLDIDYAGSVVIVEWGRGMLDGIAPSWLDIEIERPTGAGPTHASPGMHTDAVGAAAGVLTEDAEDVDDTDEPRRVRISRLKLSSNA
jgi:tRNA threonylcarbamoyladenosine biosynthesis protein TsaE